MDFLTTNVADFLAGTLAAVVGWLGVNLIGKPLLEIRKLRSEALRLGHRYALWSSDQEEHIRQAKRELFDIASRLNAEVRGQSRPLRFYCWLLRHHLEDAAVALRGLAKIVADPRHTREARQNTLNYMCVSLHAQRHLSPEAVRKLRDMAAAVRRERRRQG
jgi:hypothetical protein